MNISIKDATLDDLVRRVEAGEQIILTRDGKPFAKVEPTAPKPDRIRLLGAMKDQIWISDDFDILGAEWDEYIK